MKSQFIVIFPSGEFFFCLKNVPEWPQHQVCMWAVDSDNKWAVVVVVVAVVVACDAVDSGDNAVATEAVAVAAGKIRAA